MGTVPALEDRVLVLRDRVDTLTKTFNPDEPRDKGGKWSSSGAKLTRIKNTDENPYDGFKVRTSGRELTLYLSEMKDGKHLHIEWIGGKEYGAPAEPGQPHSVGGVALRSILRQLKTHYPEAETVGGWRASGASGNKPGGRNTTMRLSKVEDQIFYLAKDFDPNELRDAEGKWTTGGSGKTMLEHVRNAKGWLSTTRINEAVNLTYSKMKPLAKQALGHAVAYVVTLPSQSGSDYDAVQTSVEHLADQAGVKFEEAQGHVVSVLQKMKDIRMKHLGKAVKDPVIATLDKAISRVKKLRPRSRVVKVSALEDRVLVLRNKVDTVKKGMPK